MKKWSNEKKISVFMTVMAMFAVVMAMPANAANQFDKVVAPVVSLINSLVGPMLAIVGAVGSLYCILLGVKYAKAEEPQEREKAKNHLKSAIIGFVLIFILMLVLNLSIEPLKNWVSANSGVKFK